MSIFPDFDANESFDGLIVNGFDDFDVDGHDWMQDATILEALDGSSPPAGVLARLPGGTASSTPQHEGDVGGSDAYPEPTMRGGEKHCSFVPGLDVHGLRAVFHLPRIPHSMQ